MATYLQFTDDYRLKWSALSIDVQHLVTRKRKDGSTYEDWEDVGYYSRSVTGLRQATERLVTHYASTHGEVAPEELVKRLEAFVAGVEKVLARIEEAA